MYSAFFKKKAFRLIWKNPFSSSQSTLKKDLSTGFYTWFLGAPLTLAVGQFFDFMICLFFGETTYEQVAVHLLKEAFQNPLLLTSTLLSILIAAPIIEEFLFRGVLQSFLKQHMTRKSAILVASFFFAIIHISPSQGLGNISLFFSLFTFGCFLGFIYEKQGSLFSSITLHMTFNAITTIQIILV